MGDSLLAADREMARKNNHPVGSIWRMDETYIKDKGVWKYLCRAVDKQGKTVDFLLTAKRDMAAAKRSFDNAIGANGDPDKVAMNKRRAAQTKRPSMRSTPGATCRSWCAKSNNLNNIVEQNHRTIKRVTTPMLNFKSFRATHCVLAGVELMHMIRKGQFTINGTNAMSLAEQFYALEGKVRPV